MPHSSFSYGRFFYSDRLIDYQEVLRWTILRIFSPASMIMILTVTPPFTKKQYIGVEISCLISFTE
jgi:hypothetical protein